MLYGFRFAKTFVTTEYTEHTEYGTHRFRVKSFLEIGFMGNKEKSWHYKTITKTPLENWNKRELGKTYKKSFYRVILYKSFSLWFVWYLVHGSFPHTRARVACIFFSKRAISSRLAATNNCSASISTTMACCVARGGRGILISNN